jgi:tetratricopeptide (TPR) repeat protein
MTWLPLLLAASLGHCQDPKTPAALPAAALAEADRLYFHRQLARNLEDSISFLEVQLKTAPDQPALLWRLGRSLLRLGERQSSKAEKLAIYARAEKLLARSVELAPRDAQAHYWLGIAMGRRGQARGILQSLFLIGPLRREMRIVLRLDPKNGGAHHVLGEMLLDIPAVAGGDKKKGVEELELAARLEPDYSPHFIDLAEAYVSLGEKDKAKAALEHIAAIRSPADPGEYDENVQDAREMLKRLEQ